MPQTATFRLFSERTVAIYNDPAGDLRRLYAQAVADVNGIDPAGNMLDAVVDAGLAIVRFAAAKGIQYTGEAGRLIDPVAFQLDLHRAWHARDFDEAQRLVGVLAQALELTRPHCREIFLAPPPEAEKPAAPPVDGPPPVQRVEIVALPTRTTDSIVERDDTGNIKHTMQVERDVA